MWQALVAVLLLVLEAVTVEKLVVAVVDVVAFVRCAILLDMWQVLEVVQAVVVVAAVPVHVLVYYQGA